MIAQGEPYNRDRRVRQGESVMRVLPAFVCCLGCLVAAPSHARESAQQNTPAAGSGRTAAQLAKALDERGTVVLQDVLFETDKTNIRPKSTHELDEIGA